MSDIGITNIDAVLTSSHGGGSRSGVGAGEKSLEDSFERYYNKDLDLDEGKLDLFTHITDQVPVVIYELNESAINFISQESYEKALILL